MRNKTIIALLIVLMLSCLGCSGNSFKTSTGKEQLTQKEKLEDFEYMYTILKENYPYFDVNRRITKVDWLAEKDWYISRIKDTKDDDSFYRVLENSLAQLNNGHTGMVDKGFYTYAKTAYETSKDQNKAWIDQLNNPKALERYSIMTDKEKKFEIPADNIIDDNIKTKLFEKEKAAYLSIHTFNMFNIDSDMKIIEPFLKSIKDYKALIIDIRGNGGGSTDYWSKNIVPMLINKPLKDNNYIAYRGGSFTEQFIKCRSEDGSGYKNLEPINNLFNENLINLPPEIKKDFKYYDKSTLEIKPKNFVDFTGKIYLMIDGYVFSSSEAFASFAKSTGFATLIGERTGGDGIGSDPALCVLPNSGYVFRFTKEMGMTSDGACNFEHKTEPDIKVSSKGNNNLSNDEAVKAILKLVN